MASATTVTGTLQTVLTDTLAGDTTGTSAGPFVRFRLRSYAGYVPRIIGTSILAETQRDVFPASNGTFSTLLWGNDQINPTSTFYTVEYWDLGRVVSSGNWSISGTTFDLDTAPPMQTPDIPAVGVATGAVLNFVHRFTAAELLSMGTTPIQLIPPPGTGKLLIITSATLAAYATFVSAGYSNATTASLGVGYGTNLSGLLAAGLAEQLDLSIVLTGSSDSAANAKTSGIDLATGPSTLILNQPLYATTFNTIAQTAQDLVGGSSTLTIQFTYVIVTV